MVQYQPPDPSRICFGLNQEQDLASCQIFLELLGRRDGAKLLSYRLSSAEIEQLVQLAGSLLRTHLSRQEYHQHFLLKDQPDT